MSAIHFKEFSTEEHGSLLHYGVRDGTVLVYEKNEYKTKKINPAHDLAEKLNQQAGKDERFISVNEFDGWRRIGLLKSLQACFVDLDNCTSIEQALIALDDAVLPRPNIAVMSGRGVHLYWLIDRAPKTELPTWQATQNKLVKSLTAVGADARAKDCTRMLRLAGTHNSKNGEIARGYILEGCRWELDHLSNEVLGYDEIGGNRNVVSMEEYRAAHLRAKHTIGPYQLWYSRYLDLCRIADYHCRNSKGIGEGSRDTLLFLLSTALSWFCPVDALEDEISRLARTYVPSLSEREACAYTRPIVKRATLAAKGEKINFGADKRDARYHFKTETIREWLSELINPELEEGLTVLLPENVLKKRKQDRDKRRWQTDRATYLGQFANSQNASKPWISLGISRSKFFRLKNKKLDVSRIDLSKSDR